MKHRILIVCLLFASFYNVNARFISGKVVDLETDSVIPYANVYFNNSFNGTTTGLDGHFKLDIKQNHGQEIIVSRVGYESQHLKTYPEEEFYVVYLKPKPVVLTEMVIESKSSSPMSRKKMLDIFQKEFLGYTSNAKRCAILNLEDLQIVYFSSTNTLEAYCNKPLIIENKALGYHITYFLKKFTNTYEKTYFSGTYIFQEDSSLTSKEKSKIDKRRQSVYVGSRMHFFRALWNNQLSEEGFFVKDWWSYELSSYSDLVKTTGENEKFLSSHAPLEIIYKRRTSNVKFKGNGDVLFTESGYFDPDGLTWEGSMAIQRMADVLPFEYSNSP